MVLTHCWFFKLHIQLKRHLKRLNLRFKTRLSGNYQACTQVPHGAEPKVQRIKSDMVQSYLRESDLKVETGSRTWSSCFYLGGVKPQVQGWFQTWSSSLYLGGVKLQVQKVELDLISLIQPGWNQTTNSGGGIWPQPNLVGSHCKSRGWNPSGFSSSYLGGVRPHVQGVVLDVMQVLLPGWGQLISPGGGSGPDIVVHLRWCKKYNPGGGMAIQLSPFRFLLPGGSYFIDFTVLAYRRFEQGTSQPLSIIPSNCAKSIL